MKTQTQNNSPPGVYSTGSALLSAVLTATSLGLASWALQSAHWLNPNPPFLLILILAVAFSSTLALKGIRQGLALSIFMFAGLAVSAWQSIDLLPEASGLNIWSQWIGALAKPASDPTVFIAVLVMISWLTGAFGAWYAVRRRNGWVAFGLGCPLVVLNLVNLPHDFSFILPLFLGFGLALIIQTNWLKSRTRRTRGVQRLPLIPGLAVCVVVVLAAFVLPQSPAEKFSLDIEGGSLYSSIKHSSLNIFEAVPSKIKTILSSGQETVSFGLAPDLGDTVRFKITTAMPGYFATRYYDTYSASGWSSSPLTDTSITANLPIEDAFDASKAAVTTYVVENEVKTDLILVNGRVDTLSISAIAHSLQAPTGIDLSSLTSAKLLSPYTPYTVVTRINKATPDDLAKANTVYPEWIMQRYLQLPTNLPRSVRTLSQQLTRGITPGTTGSTTYNKVVAIENYLQNFAYDVDGSFISGNTDGVAAFLADRQGNCVNFASALVVMLRSVGVPARFVQGYLGSETGADGKQVLIYGRDSHAWAEVYFPDYGWITAEATPGKPGDGFSGLSPSTPGETTPPGTEIASIPGDDKAVAVPPSDEIPGNNGSSTLFPVIILGLVAALVLAIGGGTLYITRDSNPSSIYAKLGWLGKLYREPVSPFDTPSEYARRLGGRLPGEAKDISSIADTFARSRFGPTKSPNSIEKSELTQNWKKLSLKILKHRFGLGSD